MTSSSQPFPLSFAQQRLWLLDRLEPGSPVYNLPHPYLIGGALDPACLERALGEVVRRHEVLRTTFGLAGDGTALVLIGARTRLAPPGTSVCAGPCCPAVRPGSGTT